MFVSIVVPCFRSADTLPELTEHLATVMPGCATAYEVVLVVDDGGDDTWRVAAALARQRPNVRAIRLARNYGQHNALVAGVRAARYEVVVTMDDDLQHPPEQIPTLLAALTEDVDLVYGVADHEEHGAARSLASRLVKSSMARAMKVRDARHISAFRAFRSFLAGGLDQIAGPHACIDVALSWGTTRIAATTVRMRQRPNGTSGYTLRGLLRHTANMLLGYSTLPLRLVTIAGFAVGLVGLALFAQVVYRYVTGATTVAGFTTVASMVALFAAAQMVALGVLGEYIGRIHTGGMGRPTYVIRDRIDGDAPAPGQPAANVGALTPETEKAS
ncbi:glycosyltransferase family 2 protein [Pilimelia columellifera]|uniref:Glycosyltransferase family 2 protein n=1 Tax=Pilimelia columellifera subsp. columellifera TaxID=706583 RepID=A0ABP6AYZ1_9ACTN